MNTAMYIIAKLVDGVKHYHSQSSYSPNKQGSLQMLSTWTSDRVGAALYNKIDVAWMVDNIEEESHMWVEPENYDELISMVEELIKV